LSARYYKKLLSKSGVCDWPNKRP